MKNLTMHRFTSMSVFMMFLLNFSFHLIAQTDSLQNPTQFLFPEFSRSTVKMKVDKDLTIMLNYNIVTEKMVFFQKGQLFDMINYETVDTIYMQNRKFIPYGKVFYEVLVIAPVSLFIQHKGEVQTPGRPAAYDGTSQVSSSTYINWSQIGTGSNVYRMRSKPDIIINDKSLYWVRKNNTMFSFLNEKQLLKIFPERKNEIRQYIKKNLLNTENSDDLIRVINYCNSLMW